LSTEKSSTGCLEKGLTRPKKSFFAILLGIQEKKSKTYLKLSSKQSEHSSKKFFGKQTFLT